MKLTRRGLLAVAAAAPVMIALPALDPVPVVSVAEQLAASFATLLCEQARLMAWVCQLPFDVAVGESEESFKERVRLEILQGAAKIRERQVIEEVPSCTS